jgi:hypothetical protein
MFAHVLSGVDWHATWRMASAAGFGIALALVPFGVGLILDTTGVLVLARTAAIEVRGVTLLGVRVVSEALHFGAPGGVVAAEAAALALFARRCGIEPRQAGLLVAGRKWLVMRAHAIYLTAAAVLSASVLGSIRGSLPGWVLASALVPLALSIVLEAAYLGIDGERVRRARRATVAGTLVFLAAWLVESAETAVMLRLLRAPLPMAAVLAVESTISVARSAVALMPGGLGLQDLGYATTLGALGASHETAAAFVILKRLKEVAWIAIGFGIGWLGQLRASSASSSLTSDSPK